MFPGQVMLQPLPIPIVIRGCQHRMSAILFQNTTYFDYNSMAWEVVIALPVMALKLPNMAP